MKKTLIALSCCAALVSSAATATAAPAPRTVMASNTVAQGLSTSSNWSGYAAAAAGTTFSDVKATWVQPAVTCAARETSSASFWVGLGGYAAAAQGLEQIGTSSSCTNGAATYDAWYELLPAASQPIAITVSAGDTISAAVSGSGSTATLSLADVTTGKSFSTTLNVSVPDYSSAEWVAEAPSLCYGSRCSVVPLANYGSVTFTGASATGNGHTGTLTDTAWSSQGIQLGSRTSVVSMPGTVSADGSSFPVTYQAPTTATATPRPTTIPSAGRGRGHGWGRSRSR